LTPPRPASTNATPRRFVPVAEVARAHGIRGEVRLKLYHEESEIFAQKPTIRLRTPEGEERFVNIDLARNTNNGLLVKFAGTNDRNDAEALRGCILSVPRDEFPALEDGEFYACDIEGAQAVLPSGDVVGRVTELVSYPTCNSLTVQRPTGAKLEVPLVEQFVASVDTEAGVVHLVTIEGLE
jgi:16S rRNA processing protein RimM